VLQPGIEAVRAAITGGLLALAFIRIAAADSVADSLRTDPQAAPVFAQALAARDAAQAVDAYLYAASEWQLAERELAAAADAFQHGSRETATAKATESVTAYRSAERVAIGAAVLAEPRAALARLRKEHGNRYAPQTVARAESFIAQAEEALRTDPPDRERATQLAAASTAEVQRARAVTAQLSGSSAEQAVLAWQDAFARIAKSAGIELPGDTMPAASAEAMVAGIEREHAERTRLEQDLADRNDQIRRLQDEMTSLSGQLDGAARERIELARQVETQEAARAQLSSLEDMFKPTEAEVLQERDDIVIRLLGLRFAPGSSKLGKDQESLLDKVIEAIGLYSERDVIVEGHTDAAGGADANLELSRARARSVRDYLIASGRVLPARVTSEGYGESRPVASNDTDEGRAHNRRIDVRLRALETH
jgi:outer membrane protein OmpA-like peptidoglycan-associated protein